MEARRQPQGSQAERTKLAMNSSTSGVSAAAEGETSSKCVPPPSTAPLTPTLYRVAFMRVMLQKLEERVVKTERALKKLLLFRPPLPDTVWWELQKLHAAAYGRYSRWGRKRYTSATAGTDERYRLGDRHSSCAPDVAGAALTVRGTALPVNRNVTHLAVSSALQEDDQKGAQSRIRQATQHLEGLVAKRRALDASEEGSWQRGMRDKRGKPPPVEGVPGKTIVAERCGETPEAAHKRSNRPATLAARESPRTVLLEVTDRGHHEDRNAREDPAAYWWFRGGGYALEPHVNEEFSAQAFTHEFHPMLRHAAEGRSDRHESVDKPNSAIVRLMKHYHQQPDLYAPWDWEIDPLLGNSSEKQDAHTPAFVIEDALRDVVDVFKRLFVVNARNLRLLDEIAQAWRNADSAAKEADRVFVRSVRALSEALDTRVRMEEWNIALAADSALRKRGKYLLYDPTTREWFFRRKAYMADLLAKGVDSQKRAKKRHRRPAALFRDAGRWQTARPQVAIEWSARERDSRRSLKAVPAASDGSTAASPAITAGPIAAEKPLPDAAAVPRGVSAVSPAPSAEGTKAPPSTVTAAKPKGAPVDLLEKKVAASTVAAAGKPAAPVYPPGKAAAPPGAAGPKQTVAPVSLANKKVTVPTIAAAKQKDVPGVSVSSKQLPALGIAVKKDTLLPQSKLAGDVVKLRSDKQSLLPKKLPQPDISTPGAPKPLLLPKAGAPEAKVLAQTKSVGDATKVQKSGKPVLLPTKLPQPASSSPVASKPSFPPKAGAAGVTSPKKALAVPGAKSAVSKVVVPPLAASDRPPLQTASKGKGTPLPLRK